MFHQQDEMVSSYLFSFREASYPLFWISEFCLHSYLAPLKCQQNLGLTSPQPEDVPLRAWMEEHLGEEVVADKYTRLVGGTSVSFARNPDDHYAVRA